MITMSFNRYASIESVAFDSYSCYETIQICGSSIVSPRHALSATHCFVLERKEYKLAVGKHDLTVERGIEEDVRIKTEQKTYVGCRAVWNYSSTLILSQNCILSPKQGTYSDRFSVKCG